MLSSPIRTLYEELDFVCRLVARRAEERPTEAAVLAADGTLTRDELDRRANAVARHLHGKGIGKGDRVLLAVPRSTALPVGILGILRSGAAWVPVDPAYPADRIRYIGSSSRPAAVLSTGDVAGELPDLDLPAYRIEEILATADSGERFPPPIEHAPSDPAYLIYTSGSTGRPKGVLVGHGNLAHYVQAMRAPLGLTEEDRVLVTASSAFSSSVRQILVPLAAGASIVIPTREEVGDPRLLLSRARETEVTVLDLVPSYWGQLTGYLEELPPAERAELLPERVRLVASASEPLPAALPDRWRTGLGHPARLLNMFGQTETTGIALTWPIEDTSALAARGGVAPVGRPITGMGVEIADEDGRPLPSGSSGEIVLLGAGVTEGYFGDPEGTAARFSSSGGIRRLRTGDIGRIDSQGELEFLGRGDLQVKIRGHRVEPEEVESVLRAHSGVRSAAVAAIGGAEDAAVLTAFVVLRDGSELRPAELRLFLQDRLPEYAVPGRFRMVDALPLTPNGKLDRARLPELGKEAVRGPRNGVPETGTERQLLPLMEELLDAEGMGTRDSFFELGGHSLLAIRAVGRIRERFGMELPVASLFEAPTVKELAARIDRAERGEGTHREIPRLAPASEVGASLAQERLWMVQRLDPSSTAYNLGAALRLRGALDRGALERTLDEIVTRHQTLRSRFRDRDGVPSIRITEPVPARLPARDVAPLPGESLLEAAVRMAETLLRTPFDLEEESLFRAELLRLGAEDHLLVLTMHHTVSDGWSRGVLYREILELYPAFRAGLPSPLPPLPISYADHAAWQREELRREEGRIRGELEWWKETLASPPTLELPTDRPRPPVQTFVGRTFTFAIEPALREGIERLSREENATVFMGLLATFKLLLSRYAGQEDVVIGSPTAGRLRAETEPLIGFFVNTLALRTDLSGDPSFRTLLRRVRGGALEAFARQDTPFDRVVDALRLERDPARSPLFQVLFILQNTPSPRLRLGEASFEPVDLDPGAAKFDLTLSVIAEEDGFKGQFEYNTDLFDPETIEALARHFTLLLSGAIADPERPVTTLPILAPEERRRQLAIAATAERPVPAPRTIHELFEAQVARTPDTIALVHEGRSFTYRELDRWADRIAGVLRAKGVGPEIPVAICVERSARMVAGLLGILKAGGGYVPVDPGYPADRVAHMLEDSAAPVVLTDAETEGRVPAGSASILRLDRLDPGSEGSNGAGPEEGAAARAFPRATPENLAYIIYTSGSTGRPKGVMIEHRNVANFFVGMDDRIQAREPGRWLAVTSISFDISVLELFWTLSRGFTITVQGEEHVGARVPSTAPLRRKKVDFSLFYFASEAGEGDGNPYSLLLDGARFADENGFSAVWTPERHFHSFGGLYPNPSVTGAAIAAVTRNVRIRAGSVVLPLHDPIRVAEEWAMVDNLSGGRAEISVASGWHDRDFVFQPQNYDDRRDLLLEGIETVQSLWRGETIRRAGPKGEVTIGIHPRPIQPELRIWLTAGGTPDTFIRAGRAGHNLLTHLLGQSPEELTEKVAAYRKAWREAGHPGEGYVTLMLHTFIGENLEEVRKRVWGPFREYLRTSVGLIKDLAEGRGQDIRGATFTPADMEALLDHAFERYFQTSALMGTEEDAVAQVERLRSIGVDECACLIDFGVDRDAVLDSLARLPSVMRKVNAGISDDPDDAGGRPEPAPVTPISVQLREERITHLQCTPSMARLLLADPESRAGLRGLDTILIGGEAFPETLAEELRTVAPETRILNMYGPTETTVWSSVQTVHDLPAGRVPLGQPIANTRFYVVDSRGQLVPDGVAGELLIGGTSVVRGYLGRPELTEKVFLRDPFLEPEGTGPADTGAEDSEPAGFPVHRFSSEEGPPRVYRTGDRVRRRRDGSFEFLGRLDFRVKVRGHRIELGEVESALGAATGVKEAVVIVRDEALVGYVIPAGGALDIGTLRATLRETLPEYMVPTTIVELASFPLTPNGKIDRKALPAPERGLSAPAEAEYAAPSEGIEEIIAATWREVLGVDRVGRDDNFFDLGGHSLLTIRVHTLLARKVQQPLGITDLFRFPTIRALAEFLGQAEAGGTSEIVEASVDRGEARRRAMQARLQRRR